MVQGTDSLGNQSLIQSNIDRFLEPYKKTWYHIVLAEAKRYISIPSVKRFNADILNRLFNGQGVGAVSGIVIRTLRKEGWLKRDGEFNSEREIAHHREIPDYEVIHADNGN